MWFAAHKTAPPSQEMLFSKSILAVFLMAVWSAATQRWLLPLIGPWTLLIDVVAWTIMVKLLLDLSLRRALLVVGIYFVVMLAAAGLLRWSGAAGNGWVPQMFDRPEVKPSALHRS